MTSIAHSAITIQVSAQSVPSTPSWLGEVTLLVHHLRMQGALDALSERVRFARRRFGRYEVLDFVAVLFGYASSCSRVGPPTPGNARAPAHTGMVSAGSASLVEDKSFTLPT